MEAPDWKIGDRCCTDMYGDSIIYEVVCFFDRDPEEMCDLHKHVDPRDGFDDVHVRVLWKKHKAIAPTWPLLSSVVFSVDKLTQPNPLLVLAVEAE